MSHLVVADLAAEVVDAEELADSVLDDEVQDDEYEWPIK